MIDIKYIIALYLVIMNITGFAIMGIDKYKAGRKAWRISEKALFMVSFFGGSIGTLVGMYMFRHKTKHWYFVVGMPLILIIHVLVFIYLTGQYF